MSVIGHDERAARDDALLLADIAQRYYLEDQTQEQIARSIGVSRSNISRMLKEARRTGLVEIRIHHPLGTQPELQSEVEARIGLRECLILAPPDPVGAEQAASTTMRLGALAARLLNDRISDGMIVGVGWGNTVYHVVTSGYFRKKHNVSVVQLMGSVGGATPDIDGAQVAGRLGRMLGATVYYLNAPMVVSDPSVRAALLRDQHIRKTMDMARKANVTMLSLGAINESSGLYRAGYFTAADLEFIRDSGVVGEIGGTCFRQDGSPSGLELEGRLVAVPADVLRLAHLRVGVTRGATKALPSVGAIRAGLINVLVTDEECAREMLRIADSEAIPSRANESFPQTLPSGP
jgi:deoxyribonucleoside regulator